MTEYRRHLQVGVFVAVALGALAWLTYKFGELPRIVAMRDAREVIMLFDQAPGVGEDTEVTFRGYPVGKVLSVEPPTLMPHPQTRERDYRVAVRAIVQGRVDVPANVVPKVHRRGLGGSFIELGLPDELDEEKLADGAVLWGSLSEGTEFVSEQTQRQMERLIASLTRLSDTMRVQFEPRSPQEVDAAALQANVTTVVMRMDDALRNLNVYLGDAANQEHFKQGLADFAALSRETRAAVAHVQSIADEGAALMMQVRETIAGLTTEAEQARAAFDQTAVSFQAVAEEMAMFLRRLDQIAAGIAAGDGAAGRFVNDARLYESLNEASENLSITLDRLRSLVEEWQREGMKVEFRR